MVDRLEELLALLETEEDQENEDRADALIPSERSVPAAVPTEEDGGEPVPAALVGDGTRAGDRGPEEAPVFGEDGERGLVWTVKKPVAEPGEVPRRTAETLTGGVPEQLEELTRARLSTRPDREPARPAHREGQSGLEELYRRTAQTARSAALQIPFPEQTGRSVQTEPGRTAAVTVEELDRAVRRDSRRYDGAMSIY